MANQKLNIAVFTGTRAEYGLLYHTLLAIKNHPNLNLQLWVGGTHLSQQHGYTLTEIEADGFEVTLRLPSVYVGQNTALDFAQTAKGLAEYLQESTQLPDFLIVLGDRHESLAVATTAFFNRIPIVHIHGGDIVQGGMFDEPIRHALTKLAHVHFPATQASAQRILQMGEEAWRVKVVGAPALENLRKLEPKTRTEVAQQFGLDSEKPWLLLTQHPVSLWPEQAALQMQQTLDALVSMNPEFEVIATFPNQDNGGLEAQAVLKEYAQRYPQLKLQPSLGRLWYLNVLKHSVAVIGNSSSGLLETAYWGIPCINIGPRQQGRERGQNVIDVPHNTADIAACVAQLLHDADFVQQYRNTQHPFGEGRTSEKIIDTLLNLPQDWSTILNKQLEFETPNYVGSVSS